MCFAVFSFLSPCRSLSSPLFHLADFGLIVGSFCSFSFVSSCLLSCSSTSSCFLPLGRFGRKGAAINFVTHEDVGLMKDIERFYSTQIEEMPMNIAGRRAILFCFGFFFLLAGSSFLPSLFFLNLRFLLFLGFCHSLRLDRVK